MKPEAKAHLDRAGTFLIKARIDVAAAVHEHQNTTVRRGLALRSY